MRIYRRVKILFTFFCVISLSCCGWLHVAALGKEMQGDIIINANGIDSAKGSFVLRIDMLGNNDKWDEVSAPRVPAVGVIDVARKTLATLTSDGSELQVENVALYRFNDTPFWYYLVTFGKTFSTKVWQIPVFFSGKPAPPVS